MRRRLGVSTRARNLLISWLASLAVVITALVATSSAAQATIPGPFVKTNGTHLTLDREPWYLYGGSTYHTSNPGGPQSIQDEIDLALAGGLNTLRIVNMFDEQGTDPNAPFDASAWQHVDQLLAAMHNADLHAILDLSAFRNHLQNRELYIRGTAAIGASYPIPGSCSSVTGDALARCVGADWCETNPGVCVDPYSTDRANAWSNFLTWVATRTNTVTGVEYRNDPTIAIVSFAGEPNPPNSQEPLRPTTQELTNFYGRVFGDWKGVDHNHLVTSGGLLHIDWEALYGSSSGIDHDAIWALSTGDVLSIHNYFANLPGTPANDTKTSIVAAAAQSLGKPWITEEFGFPQTPSDNATTYTESDRADWVQSIYDTQLSPPQGTPSAGVAFWNLGPEVAGGSHDVNPMTPATWAVVAANSPGPHPVNVFVVNVDTTAGDPTPDGSCDDGAGGCSIREAIQEANAAAGLDEIDFDIPSAQPSGAITIALADELPVISGPLIIDGASQPGTATPNVELNGTAAPADARGLAFGASADNSSVNDLVIGGFQGSGVEISGAAHMSVTGNYLGTDVTGTQAAPNGIGLAIDGATDLHIGGYDDGSGNLISANVAQGIKISGPGDLFVSIRGNRIGTDITGTAGLGNGAQGIWSTARGIDIGGNFEGDPIGVSPGGPCTGACNLISDNGTDGVELDGASLVSGNFIGTDVTGTVALGNAEVGLIGHRGVGLGTFQPPGRNLISGNGLVGVRFTGIQNNIRESFIGTDTTGLVAIPNGDGSADAAGVELCCNTFITNVGNTFPGSLTVISGNDGPGVLIRGGATSNFLEGNLIGLGADRVTPLPNKTGILIDGVDGNTVGQLVSYPYISNTIASNAGDGIRIVGSTRVRIWSNRVANNGGDGIVVDGGSQNMIGGNGQYAGGGNTITGNAGAGIDVIAGAGIALFSNLISGNAGLGIDLGDDDVTPNDPGGGDADTGPNDLQNFPHLVSAFTYGTSTSVDGTLQGEANTTYLIELFEDASCDPSGHGEGGTFLGSASTTADGSGSASFTKTIATPTTPGHVVTATATRGGLLNESIPLEGTSEFSTCETLIHIDPPDAPTTVSAAGGDGRAEISWTPPTTGQPQFITGYVVTPRDETTATNLPPINTAGTGLTATGLTNGHDYTFTVQAVNAAGSGASAISNVVTPALGAPPPVIVTEPVDPGGGTVSTGSAPSSTDPVTTEVDVPAGSGGGTVTIAEGTISQDPPTGWRFLSTEVHIDSTASTSATNPLRIEFSIDDGSLGGETPQTLQIFRTEAGGTPTLVLDCASDPSVDAVPDPCIPLSSRQSIPGGGGARLTVVTSTASEWNIAAPSLVPVSVTDSGVTPRSVSASMGQRVQWTFSSTKLHSATDALGVGPTRAPLFDSGLKTSGSYTYRFIASGTYSYRSTGKKDGAAFNGTVAVPMAVTPTTGHPTTSFTLTVASQAISGYRFDVQLRYRKPGSSKWSSWSTFTSTAASTLLFVPTKGAGTYAFHARLVNVATGRTSGWSPDVNITVTT